ncbi:MAG: CDP-alcohol phosphatidyltransferase family protein [Clostridia bacterium]|nr:CDP-alcohol phosphatidyltransferase family protein [Clostridia bacterium]
MDKDRFKYKVITIPNLLSFFRIALIPFFVWAYSFRDDIVLSMVILVLSALTDIVDGFVARRFAMVSNVGKILDPIADKLTQLAVLACLCVRFPRMIVPLVVLVVKEVANGIIGLVMMHKNRDPLSAVWHGKLTTVVIYLTTVAHLVWPRDPDIPDALSYTMIGLSLFMMMLSLTLYTVRNIKIIKEKK